MVKNFDDPVRKSDSAAGSEAVFESVRRRRRRRRRPKCQNARANAHGRCGLFDGDGDDGPTPLSYSYCPADPTYRTVIAATESYA